MQTINPIDRNLTSITASEAVQLGADNTILFGRLFFPKTFRQASPHFHYEMARDLDDPAARQVSFAVFRDGAKTSLLRTFTARRISYAISRTIMFVSSSQGHSAFSLRWLRRQISFNTRWAQTFGLRRGDKWTDEILEIYHGVDQTPITVLAMGITGQIRGFNIDDYRPDLIIADDVQTEEAVATEEGRVKLKALFHGGLVNSLAAESDSPDAKIVLLQTPMEKGDIIDECNSDPSWAGKVFGIFDEGGESRWPAKWSTALLQSQKETAILMGRLSIWMREKECKIVRGEKRSFMVERLQYWDELPPTGMQVVLAIDPASSDSKDADDQVCGAVGLWNDSIYILDYEAEKGEMPDALSATFFQQMLTWHPTRAAVESIAYQRVLAWYLKNDMVKKRMFLPVHEIQDRRNKSDRIIQAISPFLHYGRLFMFRGQKGAKMVQQMTDYAAGVAMHDDCLDMLAMAIMELFPYMIQASEEDERTIDQEMRTINEQEREEYPALDFRGAP